jgi:hypothetical protein
MGAQSVITAGLRHQRRDPVDEHRLVHQDVAAAGEGGERWKYAGVCRERHRYIADEAQRIARVDGRMVHA